MLFLRVSETCGPVEVVWIPSARCKALSFSLRACRTLWLFEVADLIESLQEDGMIVNVCANIGNDGFSYFF